MITSEFNLRIDELKKADRIFEALQEILIHFDLLHPRFAGFYFRDEFNPHGLLLTAEGTDETGISIHVPKNILDFDLSLIANLLMHEVYHIAQRTGEHQVLTREEREWQAYYEMIYHDKYPHIPRLSAYYLHQFGEKALSYYQRMDDVLKRKYFTQKLEVEQLLSSKDSIENLSHE